jgi:tetratricopeptide (TPR) repeat protein
MAELLQCLSPRDAETPYKFKATDINVFTFEEALYHCYHYWKQSADEFVCEGFISWVHTALGLAHIAGRLREIRGIENFTERYCAFLAVTPYFSDKKINALKKEFGEWENRLEWEKLKERGDYFMNNAVKSNAAASLYNGDYAKAFSFYNRALAGSEVAEVLNNAAVSLMKQSRFDEASGYFERAMDADPENVRFTLNYIESLVFGGEYDRAWEAIGGIEGLDLSETAYFKGEINFKMKRYYTSIPFYEQAISVAKARGEPWAQYLYRLCDVLIRIRQFEKALETVNRSETKDKDFLRKQADIHAAYGNLPAAIKCMESALMADRAAADIWTRLASYYRMDYDFNRANGAITTAMSIAPNNPHVKLECARIRKAQGLTKEYQSILSDVLNGFKTAYRLQN